jgi:hypothetical protein
MKTNTRISGIFVDYSNYLWAHGKSPRGNGSWAFFLGDENKPRFYQGSFTETKKQAVKDAKACGYWRVKVGS